MTKRTIEDTLFKSPVFGRLDCRAKLLYLGMIAHTDDQGRLMAEPSYLRSIIFPFDDGIALSDIGNATGSLIEAQYIVCYIAGELPLAQILGWWDMQSMQYAQPSKYLPPDGWEDRMRFLYTKGRIVTYNWRRKDGTRTPDTCNHRGLPHELTGQEPDEPQAPVNAATGFRFDWSDDLETPVSKRTLTPAQESALAEEATEKQITKMSLDPRKFMGGLIPDGKGNTPLEIFYEYVSVREVKLSKRNLAEISKITDLGKWRQVQEEWHGRGYKPGNIIGQTDWYNGTIPERPKQNNYSSGSNSPDTSGHSERAGDIELGKRSALSADAAKRLFS